MARRQYAKAASPAPFIFLRSDRVKILFLAANPADEVVRLQIEQEFCAIAEKIHGGTHGHQLKLVPVLGIKVRDLEAALLRHRPDIVHFSGHGNKTSGIVLEDEGGKSKTVSWKALADLFSILNTHIRVVVLNACYARDQAKALTEAVDCAIGMNDKIDDRAAILFSAYFYQSLAFGYSVKEAFNLALAQFGMEGIDGVQIPELLVREGANAAEIRIDEMSHQFPEPGSGAPAPGARSVVAAEAPASPPAFSASHPGIKTGGLLTPTRSGEAPRGKLHPIAFFPWLFAGVALVLITDVLRRFLSENSGWPDITATVVQLVFILFAITALLLTGMALLRLSNPLAEQAARLGGFDELPKARRAAIATGIVLGIALGLWLSLPALAHYYNQRGSKFQYAEQPDLSRARESYQQAVRLNPGYAAAHYNLALVQEDLSAEKAMEEYRLAIRYDSHLYAAYNNLARLRLHRGQGNDYKDALNILTEAVDLSPPDESVQFSLNKNLGWANYLLKHYPLAETYLRRAISLRSQGAAAHCLLAYVLKEQGKPGATDECYDCVALAPGEKDVEANWLSDAQDCLRKGGGQ
jgi:tetratricopeptide (TPR) repeat protein